MGRKSKHHKRTSSNNKKRIISNHERPQPGLCWDPFPVYYYDLNDVFKANKYVLLVITYCLFCFSVITVVLASYLIAKRKSREEIVSAASFSDYWLNVSLCLLISGLVSSVITFCGCVGVYRENMTLIRIFYIPLMLLIALKLCVVVFVFVLSKYSRPALEWLFAEHAVREYRANSDVEAVLDYLQTSLQCCGLREDGYRDWASNAYFNCSAANPSQERCGVPWSCCRNGTGLFNELCGLGTQQLERNLASRSINTMGCILALQEWVLTHALWVGLCFLAEALLAAVVIFQCTRLVNELQMLRGTYRGPWWLWVGTAAPPPRVRSPPTPPEGAVTRGDPAEPPSGRAAALVTPQTAPPQPGRPPTPATPPEPAGGAGVTREGDGYRGPGSGRVAPLEPGAEEPAAPSGARIPETAAVREPEPEQEPGGKCVTSFFG